MSNDKKSSLPWRVKALSVGVPVLWVLWLVFFDVIDKFDVLSPLFSGLAFVAIIVTLIYQKQELELQRKDLDETRSVLAETSKATERTASANQQATAIAEKNLLLQAELAKQNEIQMRAQSIVSHINLQLKLMEVYRGPSQSLYARARSDAQTLLEELDILTGKKAAPSEDS